LRFVEKALRVPHHCAVIPHMGGAHRDGYVDTGVELAGFDNHVYVSVVAVREILRELKWPQPEDHAEALRTIDALQHQVVQLEDQVREADRFAEAAEYTLGRFGTKVQRKPGRPKTQKEAA
jgi:hypothetical protein